MKGVSKIAAIVSAFNEEKTIARVADDLLKISFLSEIIIVNDSSSDRTGELLAPYSEKIIILTNKKNKGKPYSAARGIETAKSDLLILLDGDIVNYTEKDLRNLTAPVLAGDCDYSVYWTNDPIFFRISGIRCYWREDLLRFVPRLKRSSRYGLEVFLNKYMKNKKMIRVRMPDFHHYIKFEKFGIFKALFGYVFEGLSIVKQFFIHKSGWIFHSK